MELARAPDYLPEPGFWAAALRASVITILTGAQYVRQSRHNRARIRTPQDVQWLTIPVRRGQLGLPIAETLVSPEGEWWRHHAKAIRYNYGSSPFYEHYMPELVPHLGARFGKLDEITVPLIQTIARLLGCTASIVIKADPPIRAPRDFRLDEDEGYRVIEMTPFTYRQAFPRFVGDLSVLDLLFNHGPSARDMILSNSSVSTLQTKGIE
ncbi:MAG: hypothetical protein ACI80V_001846 [Rhodothermales bacterium]